MQNIVLINDSRTAWPTKILMQLLSFSDSAQYMLIFGLGALLPEVMQIGHLSFVHFYVD